MRSLNFSIRTPMVLLMALAAQAASAQGYPNKAIHIISAGAGGAGEVAARLVGQGITEALGQPVVVDPRGGSIVIHAGILTKAAPDGYTLLVHSGTLWITPLLQQVPYDAEKDFVPVTWITSSPTLLVAHPSVPAHSVKELIALAKSKPGSLNYSTTGTASTGHLAGELFKAMAGINIVRVNYKDGPPSRNDLIGGRIELTFQPVEALLPHVKTGRLRALAVTSAKPSPLTPGIPTVAESGLPNYEALFILGMFAPAKTPAGIVDQLYKATQRTLSQPEVQRKFASSGAETVGSTPAEFTATIKADTARWSKVIKDAGIKGD